MPVLLKQPKLRPDRFVERLLDLSLLDTNTTGLLWTSDQLTAEAANYTTHKNEESNIRALKENRTRTPTDQQDADLRLTSNDHCDIRILVWTDS